MSILITGAFGFIGANLVHALNARGETDLLVVDNLARADKFHNLVDARFAEFIDKTAFIDLVRRRTVAPPSLVFHQGACSDTMEQDGRYMLDNNYRYSIELLQWCQAARVPFVYASSAAVYGMGPRFVEAPEHEKPLNVYGYSKLAFDQYVRRMLPARTAPVIGLRYFNVYGPREAHKGKMASVAFHHVNQYRADGRVRLFEASHGYAAGEQRRDFIHVDDVVAGNLHVAYGPDRSGIYNLGTGRAQSFNDVALTVVNTLRASAGETALTLPEAVAAGRIAYIPFPDALKGRYQAFTQADVGQLRASGFTAPMATVQEGTARYVRWLLQQQ